jgi:hypothetical protein
VFAAAGVRLEVTVAGGADEAASETPGRASEALGDSAPTTVEAVGSVPAACAVWAAPVELGAAVAPWRPHATQARPTRPTTNTAAVSLVRSPFLWFTWLVSLSHFRVVTIESIGRLSSRSCGRR